VTEPVRRVPWRQSLLYRLYESLTRNDPVTPADLIFVMAGRMERKRYGLDLYRAGLAPRLLLSIGRFEISKMGTLDFAETPRLVAERDRTPPDQRHFFCEIAAAGTRIEKARLPRWNTYGELLGLRAYLDRHPAARILIVSTAVHLRRTALAFQRIFRGLPIEAHFCPVPPELSSVGREAWWTRRYDRRFVLKETGKLAGYSAILKLPDWMVRRVMRLRE